MIIKGGTNSAGMVYIACKTIGGNPYYYLVKSIKVAGQVQKLQRYLGRQRPSANELARLERAHAAWFETQAVKAKATLSAGNYSTEYLDFETIEALEQVHYHHLASRQLLSAREILKAGRSFSLAHLRSTLALNDIHLSPSQIQAVLLDEALPAQITLKQVKLLLNLEELREILTSNQAPLDLPRLLRYHKILAKGCLRGEGSLRDGDARLSNSSFVPLPAILLDEELKTFLAGFNNKADELHPFVSTTLLHHKFGQLHPFEQGNGLLARELYNYRLLKAGLPPFLFPMDNESYLAPLQAADGGDMGGYVNAYAELYLANHQQLLAGRRGLEKAVQARHGQSHLDHFQS